MFHQNKITYDSIEDWEETPAGKAMLKMPWLWDEGEYPKSKSEPANPSVQATGLMPARDISDMSKPLPDPFASPVKNAFKPLVQTTFPSPGHDAGNRSNGDGLMNQFSRLKPQPYAWQDFQSRQSAKAVPVMPAARTFPYKDMGNVIKPVSDKTMEMLVKPTATCLKETVKNKHSVELFPEKQLVDDWTPVRHGYIQMAKEKQPFVATPEVDQIRTIGAAQDALGKVYNAENLSGVTDSLLQGKTDGQERHFRNPPDFNMNNVLAATHSGETLGHDADMSNPNPDATKGFENSLRDLRLSGREIVQLGNKLFDPEGKYLDTREMQSWINQERQYLQNNSPPDLIDFTKLDWKNNPDKVIELGGKYFRQQTSFSARSAA
ncbi:MAG: hypothetical protein GX776_10205, partial [Oxalobacter sp.]|nr:hypothetical protein [Oxalobacter sp.]